MAKYTPKLDTAFAALSDGNRRAMIERLARGPATVSELASGAAITLPSCLAHIAKLEAAGLVVTEKLGRTRTCRLHADAFRPAQDWLDAQRALWVTRLRQLDAYATTLAREKTDDPRS